MKKDDFLDKKQRSQAYATNLVIEHVRLDPITNVPNPSPEAIREAKKNVDENPK